MIKVTSDLIVYEFDGTDSAYKRDCPSLSVRSHWNRDNFVVIAVGDHKYTVSGRDLVAAIVNAQNTGSR